MLAARLIGAVDAGVRVINGLVEPELIYFHAETLAGCRAQLGEAAVEAARLEGEKWPLEEAVASVLAWG